METLKSVLVIDDEISMREICECYLSDHYSHVYLAEDALQGLEILKKHKVDVILVDINMPKMNGFDFIEAAKNKYPKIKFIIMSGNVSVLNLHRAIRVGVFDFLEKPFSRSTLLEKVESAFKHGLHIQAAHSLKMVMGEINREKAVDRKALLIELREEISNKFDSANGDIQVLKSEIEQLFNSRINADQSGLIYFLTPAERKISQMLDAGLSARTISRKMDRSLNTIQVHIRSIRKKLGLAKSSPLLEEI
jgi:DNA-binding NarL/FixJ family response regulator